MKCGFEVKGSNCSMWNRGLLL